MREVLDRVGDKWSVLVIARLGEGTQRYGSLLRTIDGISQRMLTRTLRSLERDGLVTRVVHPVVPPRVDYDLTDLGRTLLGPVGALAIWADEYRSALRENRRRYDRQHEEHTTAAAEPR
jgi:DNA-binding HxlR family transcriptional regulator